MKITNKTNNKLVISLLDSEDEIEHINLEPEDSEELILIEETKEIIVEDLK